MLNRFVEHPECYSGQQVLDFVTQFPDPYFIDFYFERLDQAYIDALWNARGWDDEGL
jgi:hypothetical protein